MTKTARTLSEWNSSDHRSFIEISALETELDGRRSPQE